MSFISSVASAFFFFFVLCAIAEAHVYRLSKDLTTAVNDSFTSELVFGVEASHLLLCM